MDRLCTICNKLKPTDQYYKNSRSSDGLMRHCKSCHNAMNQKWIEKHPLGRFEMQRRNRALYRKRHPDRVKAQRQKAEEMHGWKYRERRRIKYKNLKAEVLLAYGGRCVCCGEENMSFLSLDHVNNDGAAHRKTIPSSTILQWAKDNNYPVTIQALCYNCNLGRYFNGRFSEDFTCPHMLIREVHD